MLCSSYARKEVIQCQIIVSARWLRLEAQAQQHHRQRGSEPRLVPISHRPREPQSFRGFFLSRRGVREDARSPLDSSRTGFQGFSAGRPDHSGSRSDKSGRGSRRVPGDHGGERVRQEHAAASHRWSGNTNQWHRKYRRARPWSPWTIPNCRPYACVLSASCFNFLICSPH